MSVVTVDFATEDDPLGTPVFSITETDIRSMKLRMSINEIGGGEIVMARDTWEASPLIANRTYYARVYVPYIDSPAALFGLWFKGGQYVLASKDRTGAEIATLVGFGPM